MMMEAGIFSEILVHMYQTISGHIPEGGNLHFHGREQRVNDGIFT